jgi:hypothetical protein
MRLVTGLLLLGATLFISAWWFTPVCAPGAPYVISSTLPDGSVVNPSSTVNIILEFSAPMDWQTVYDAFVLTPNKGSYTLMHGNTNLSITLSHLVPGTKYKIIIGSTASDYQGNTMTNPYTLTFTSWGTPPQNEEPLPSMTIILILLAISIAVVVVCSVAVIIRRRRRPQLKKAPVPQERPPPPPPEPQVYPVRSEARVSVEEKDVDTRRSPVSSERLARLRCGVCRRIVRRQERVTCKQCNTPFHEVCAERLTECPVCRGK